MRRIVNLDARNWNNVPDFYTALLRGIEAPDWHGKSIAALVDSMIYGGINDMAPPYTVRVLGGGALSGDVADEVRIAKQAIEEARIERREATGVDVDIDFEIA